MAHLVRWFTYEKNGDLPITNGDLPTKNGDVPIKMVLFHRFLYVCGFSH